MFSNFNISIMKEGDKISYEVHRTEKKFRTIAELLEYYKRSRLNPSIRSIGVECVDDSSRLLFELLCRQLCYFYLTDDTKTEDKMER